MVEHGYVSAGAARTSGALVSEFQPFDGHALAVVAFLALLAWRRARRPDAIAPWRDPAVVMTVLCWTLGYVAARFWVDWGMPALMTVAAIEIQAALESRPARRRARRSRCSRRSGLLVVLALGADVNQRWTQQVGRPFLSRQNPTHAPWLPEPGGVAYSSEMGVFYALFFANPDGPWRYALGFEPALMRPEDYAVYRDVKRSRGDFAAYVPWLAAHASRGPALRPVPLELGAAHPGARVVPAHVHDLGGPSAAPGERDAHGRRQGCEP